jgi:nitrogenase molybdenum-iron protein alpha/beta subunit
VILVTAFEFQSLLNLPLDRMVRQVAGDTGRPMLFLPSRSLSGDWLDGYAEVNAVLAKWIRVDPSRRSRGTVAIVGHLMDRTEGDQAGNIAELRRLLATLGLRCATVWLAGGTIADLARIESAETIVSLPYAREAADVLAKRLGADVVECELPVGLGRTSGFLKAVASRMGLASEAESLIERETSSAIRDCERAVSTLLTGRRLALSLPDPYLRQAVSDLCTEIGVGTVPVEDIEIEDSGPPPVVLGNSLGTMAGVLRVPMGYPNYLEHPVTHRPFLGYAGFRVMVERLGTAFLRREAGSGW